MNFEHFIQWYERAYPVARTILFLIVFIVILIIWSNFINCAAFNGERTAIHRYGPKQTLVEPDTSYYSVDGRLLICEIGQNLKIVHGRFAIALPDSTPTSR